MAVSPSLIAEAVGWRREFHAAPELGYQEQETSRRVAEQLIVAESTVKTHVSHLMKKFQVASRLKLVVAVHKTQGA